MGPAKMPPDVVARISADVQKVLAEPAAEENLSGVGVALLSGSAVDLRKLVKFDLARCAKLAWAAHTRAEQIFPLIVAWRLVIKTHVGPGSDGFLRRDAL